MKVGIIRNAASLFQSADRKNMLTTDTFEKALDLLELGYTFPSITEETGITTEDAEAVHVAWFNGTSEQVSRELQLAGVLELAAAKLRSGQGWDEGTTGDVLREVLHLYIVCNNLTDVLTPLIRVLYGGSADVPYRDGYFVVADFRVVHLLTEPLFGEPRLAIIPLPFGRRHTHILRSFEASRTPIRSQFSHR
jgi:hypothetical protein